MKKLCTILVALTLVVLCIVLLPTEARAAEVTASGTCGENLTWVLDEEGTLTISGTGAMADYQYDSTSPTFTTHPWKNVASSIKKVIIGNGVTSIGDDAFYNCSSLTSVTIPNSVTSIGGAAFYNCSSLTGIWVDANNVSYSSDSKGVLYNKNKTQLVLVPSTLSGSYAIPDSVTSIGKYAFSYCTSLTSITIPDSVTSIGSFSFSGCTSLTSITIPDSVTSIGSFAFGDCTSLTIITIPDSVTSIGDWAFSDCTSLTSITIGDSVISIGSSAFIGCSSLTSITIPDSVTSIGDDAFYNCSSLTSITIGDSVTSIGDYTFIGCSSLTSITIGDSVTSIGSSAFIGCSSLTSITIGDSVTSIGNYAFYYCSSLTSITIPDSVTSIGYNAFYKCSSLTTVTYCGTEEQWSAISIDSNNTCLTNATRSYHSWSGGDCHTLQNCSVCGERGGDYQHIWIEASCTNKKFCYICGTTEGDYGHQWVAVTCTEPKYCSVCGVTEGEPLGHNWTAANCTDPTTCSRCGKTSAQPLGHKFDHDKDYICNTCGYSRLVEEPTLKFYSAKPSLSFQDYIGMQILIRNVDVAKYDEVYVIAVQEGPEGSVETRLEGIPFYGLYQVFDQQVLSWSMTEQVTLTLYAEADGVIYQGISVSESVKSLAMQMLKTSTDALKSQLLVDMLNYGAAVQTAFNHNPNVLPNADLGDYAALGTTGTPTMNATNSETGSGSVAILQTSTSMQSKVEIQFLFAQNISAYEAKAAIGNTALNAVVDTETMGAYGYTIVRVAIGAANMRDVVTFALYDTNGNPVTVVKSVSVEALVKNQVNGAQGAVIVAMMHYGDAVAAYAKG